MIYFLKRADGLVKIGTTTNFYRRLSQLEKEHQQLDILGWQAGDKATEKSLHKRFASLRIINEWFYPATDLMNYISHEAIEGAPSKPEKNLSNEQLYQMIYERDAYIQRMLANISEADKRFNTMKAQGIQGAMMGIDLAKGMIKQCEQIQKLENKVAELQRILYKNNMAS